MLKYYGSEKLVANFQQVFKEVLQIRELYKNGITQTEIALRYEISQPHVSDIVRNKYWAHI